MLLFAYIFYYKFIYAPKIYILQRYNIESNSNKYVDA